MRVTIPHALGRNEARRRIAGRIHELGSFLPGMASVRTEWTDEDRLRLDVGAMGQAISGHIEIEESCVVFDVALPPALGFVQPIVESAIRSQGQKLLGPPSA